MKIKSNLSKQQLFWLLQCFGWGLFTLLNLTARQYFVYFHYSELINSLVLGGSLLLSSSLLRKYYQKSLNNKQLKSQSIVKSLINMLLASMVAGFLTMGLYALIIVPNQEVIFGQTTPQLWLQLLIGSPMIMFLLFAWSVIYAIFKKQQQLKQAKRHQEQLGQSLQAAKLDILLSQLNPHFIFNAINNIRALIIEDSNKARDMLANLSEVMRYTMQINKAELISLTSEINVVKQYIALNKLQFEDKLCVEYIIDEQTLDLQLPPMILQLLIENALKHGIGKLKTGGLIKISSQLSVNGKNQPYWLLSVENSGQLLRNETKDDQHAPITIKTNTGIGIKNIKERLAMVFAQQAKFTLTPTTLGVLAQISLPVVKQTAVTKEVLYD